MREHLKKIEDEPTELSASCVIDIDNETEGKLSERLAGYGVNRQDVVRYFCNLGADHCVRGLTFNDLKAVKIRASGKGKFDFECKLQDGRELMNVIEVPIYRPRHERLGYDPGELRRQIAKRKKS